MFFCQLCRCSRLTVRLIRGRATQNTTIITRNISQSTKKYSDKINEDGSVSTTFINRNPRNLEYMGIQHKRAGWPLQFPRRDYWHKLVLDRSHRNTSASVVHTSGRVVVSASTAEDAIRKHLHSATDVSAAENIGRVLAQRMVQSGLTEVMFDTLETPIVGPAIESFTKALQDAGIELTERNEIQREPEIGTDYETRTTSGGKN